MGWQPTSPIWSRQTLCPTVLFSSRDEPVVLPSHVQAGCGAKPPARRIRGMSRSGPFTATTLWRVTARDGSTSGRTVPAPAASFARRHPILAGFGVLAGLSLFAAYFPISAIVTGVVVGAHASGADRAALSIGRRLGSRLAQRWRTRHHGSGAPSPTAEPPVSPPAPSIEGRALAGRGVGGREAARTVARQPQSALHRKSAGRHERTRRVRSDGQRLPAPSRPGRDDRGLGDL